MVGTADVEVTEIRSFLNGEQMIAVDELAHVDDSPSSSEPRNPTRAGVATVIPSEPTSSTVTQWIEDATGGRSWSLAELARSWVAVLVAPRTFFREGVFAGDQAPGLLFVVAVVLVEEATRFALVPGVVPVFAGRPALSTLLALGVAALFVAPAVLHLVAAVQTLLLIPFAPDRGGVSETVQVIAYATAPAAFAGIPVPEVRVLAAIYGAVLLTLGIAVRHRVLGWRAVLLGAVPNAIVFGFAFRGFAAIRTLLEQWYVI